MARKKKKLVIIDWIAVVLLLIGGLNWGLFGAFSLDLVNLLLGSIVWLQRTVYVTVGLSAVWIMFRSMVMRSFMR